MSEEKYPIAYKLIKDLPTLSAGAIFEEDKGGEWTCYKDSRIEPIRYRFTEKDLHHNPDWFKKIYKNNCKHVKTIEYFPRYDAFWSYKNEIKGTFSTVKLRGCLGCGKVWCEDYGK